VILKDEQKLPGAQTETDSIHGSITPKPGFEAKQLPSVLKLFLKTLKKIRITHTGHADGPAYQQLGLTITALVAQSLSLS